MDIGTIEVVSSKCDFDITEALPISKPPVQRMWGYYEAVLTHRCSEAQADERPHE